MSDAVEKALELIQRDAAVRMPRFPAENFTLREGRRWAAMADSGLLHGVKQKLARQRAEFLLRRGSEKLAREQAVWRLQAERIMRESMSAQWAVRECELNAEAAARVEAEKAALLAGLSMRERLLHVLLAFVCMGAGLGLFVILLYLLLSWIG